MEVNARTKMFLFPTYVTQIIQRIRCYKKLLSQRRQYRLDTERAGACGGNRAGHTIMTRDFTMARAQ